VLHSPESAVVALWSQQVAAITAGIVFFFASNTALASEPPKDPYSIAVVEAALAALDANKIDEHWYFTMRIDHEGIRQVVRSDPRETAENRRTLVLVNDVPATEAEKAEFRESEIQRIEEQDAEKQGFSYLVDSTSLNLLDVNEGVAEYAFVPVIPKLEDAGENLRGKLVLDTNNHQILSIDVFNIEAFSPAVSVTLEQFHLRFAFSQVQDANLLALTENKTRGKFAFVKSFETVTRIEFSEYQALEQ